MIDPVTIYHQRIAEFEKQQERIRRKLLFIPWTRLSLFILMITGVILFIRENEALYILGALTSLAGFLTAGWFDYRLKRKIKTLENLAGINRSEIAAIGGNYSVFEPGSEVVSEDHPYTHDLDIFGQGSLFQYVNRTSTIFGKKRLAEYFINAFQFRDEINVRQQAIGELADKMDLRHQLNAIFFEEKTQLQDLTVLTDWLAHGKQTDGSTSAETDNRHLLREGNKKTQWTYLRLLAYAGPVVTISCLVLAIAGFVPSQLPVLLVLVQLIVVFTFGRQTQKVHQAVTSRVNILRKYAAALSLIERSTFNQAFSKKLKNDLMSHENESPGQVIHQFSTLLNWMDSNLNLVVSVILNGLLMFNIHLLMAVEKWRVKYGGMIPRWFEVLAEFDALASLANLTFNNPDFTFPEQSGSEFLLIAEGIGHPLLSRDQCVKNDIEIRGWNQFCIITGANMSGKSTFLRTIGTNYLLAMMGAPVNAGKFIFYPVEIHSSIRTNDSLVKRESYFYAELKRLKEIIDELESGRQMLILLDEILKGTNSADKQTGSIALIKQLMNYNVVGMFATHDLALGDLITITRNIYKITVLKSRLKKTGWKLTTSCDQGYAGI